VVLNGRVEQRAVTLGGERDDEVVVSAGLAAGERVVLDAPPGLVDGAKVEGENSR